MSDKPILDQVAHTTVGCLAVLPAVFWPNPLTFALATGVVGYVRELTEVAPLVTWQSMKDAIDDRASQMDVAFWTLGGFIAGFGVYL